MTLSLGDRAGAAEAWRFGVTNTGASAASTLAVAPRDADPRAQLTVPMSVQIDAGQTATVSSPFRQPAGSGILQRRSHDSPKHQPARALLVPGRRRRDDIISILATDFWARRASEVGAGIQAHRPLRRACQKRYGPVSRGIGRWKDRAGRRRNHVFGIAAAIVDLGPAAGPSNQPTRAG